MKLLRTTDEYDEEDLKNLKEIKKFTTFHESYKIITFMMCTGNLYPNPGTDRLRLIIIPILLIVSCPFGILISIDIVKDMMIRDIVDIIRHSTILGPFLGTFWKMILMYYKKQQAKEIIDEIDRDYAIYNTYPYDYRKIVAAHIRNSHLFSEIGWTTNVCTCVLVFPLMAIVSNLYSFLFTDDPVKYMIHDVNRPMAPPEARFESPFFEILFAYTFCCCMLYVLNFTGYDGFFGLAINHACLKMTIYCKGLEDAFKLKNVRDVNEQVTEVITEQARLYKYLDLIQDTFNIWLGTIFAATMIQICTCLYKITEGYGIDLRYVIFMTGSVIHIYLPCRYAAKLKSMTVETSTQFYCSGWEKVNDERLRKMLVFMIARAQEPYIINAFDMLAFDMELFVSILQTSYSMFTLLRS